MTGAQARFSEPSAAKPQEFARGSRDSDEQLFAPLSPHFLDDPYPVYRRLRHEDPVHWHDELDSWVVSRYEDCLRVVQDSESFAADYRRIGETAPEQSISVQTTDPPEQEPVRRLLVAAFRAQDMGELTAGLRAFVQHRFAAVEGRESVDVVKELAVPVASYAGAALLGGELSARKDFQEASQAVVDSMMAGVAPETEQPGLRARAQLSEMLRDEYRRTNGHSDVSGGILGYLRENEAERIVGTDMLMNSLRAVLLAALNSGQRFLGNAMNTLVRTPDALHTFRDLQKEQRQTALNELLRFDTPFQAQERAVTAATTLRGRRIALGDRIVVLFGAAHRDPEKFSAPDRLDLSRSPNPHFGFGRGPHSCLGARLAVAEGRVLLTEFATRYPNSTMAGEAIREPNPTLRGLSALPVTLT